MIFEDALAQLRLGKKIKHPSMDDDVWFQGCYVSLFGERIGGISIVKMKGDCQHSDMGTGGTIDDMLYPGTLIVKEEIFEKPCKHGKHPQLDLFLVMSDEWEVFE